MKKFTLEEVDGAMRSTLQECPIPLSPRERSLISVVFLDVLLSLSILATQSKENHEKCEPPDTIDFGGWRCPECGQIWSPEETEPGGFVWTKVEDDD